MKLQNQVAIVTGAGRNIGEQIAKLFAREGAHVAVVDLDRGRGERVATRSIARAGGRWRSSPTSRRAAMSRRYGAPHRRDHAAIARDIAEGYVTPEAAARDYGYPASPKSQRDADQQRK